MAYPNDNGCKINFDKKILSSLFSSISAAYKASDAKNAQREYFYKSQYAYTRYNTKNTFERGIRYLFKELLIGYGEKPFNTLITLLAVVIFFSICFMYSGVRLTEYDSSNIINSYTIKYNVNFPHFLTNIFNLDYYYAWFKDFGNIFFYNFQTFSSGAINLTPLNPLGKIFATIEIFLGISLIGAWIATLFRKLLR